MKIVHIIFSLKTGGAEILLINLLNNQVKNSRVTLIVINRSYDLLILSKIDPRITIILLNRKEHSLQVFPILRLNFILITSLPNIVHLHQHNILPIIFFKILYKTILTLHDVKLSCNYLPRFDALISISKSVYIDIKVRYNLDSFLIYNGIPLDFKVSNKIKCVSGNLKIIQLARLDYKKRDKIC